ncbi:putative disease resistance protein [Cinnamomum micranthum f. kanehirae]|uniref:Putative disease resistance protein n=1 Tax=Cinnamomum micranthum f. kanehirae TaxID=337451 RepID=A0A3S3NMC9_9MAGN|nr:putative disease resistance protein [Cinnamomum micranthum f. kanehirae]
MEVLRIVIQPITEASKYLLVTTKRQASYLVYCKKYVENLRSEGEKLKWKINDVQRLVEVAERNNEVINDTVQGWLANAQGIIADVQRLDDQAQGNLRCFHLRLRYKMGKEAKKKIATVLGLQNDGDFTSISCPNRNTNIEFLPDGDFYKFESTELAMKQVMDAVKDEDKNIIGVYGMGGVGKTTLVKQVAKLVKNESLYEEVVMVLLSKNPDPKGIQDDIAKQLGMRLEDGSIHMRACELSKRLNQPKNVLIILDNLWDRLELADLGIPIPRGKEHKGCKIIITTRDMEVCDIMESPAKIEVKVLPEQDSWRLFREKAGGVVDTFASHDLPRKVAKECGGLPIAIVTLGRALRNKEELVWKNALLELRRSNPVNIKDMNEKVFTSLEMSYNYLESEEAKSLFLLCSLFEEGYHISMNDLIRYGMGEGLFSNVNTLEEASFKVHALIGKLKASSLLLERESDNRVKMHDLVRNAATSIATRYEHGFFVKIGAGLKEWPENENLKECKRISLAQNNIESLPWKGITK